MMVIHCWQHGRGAFPFYQAILLIRCEMYRYSIYIARVEKQSTLTIKNVKIPSSLLREEDIQL